ncbi:MAG: 16S rRNA (guanine(527)-N(7))-methyltransferase RsmG [Clostridium sp.]|nr:16S rRNA (guanine(527)-N(7))-methyltransferase RsmG [Clostridium sp.]
MEERFAGQLKEEMSLMGIELTGQQVSQFAEYYRLLLEWNSVMNLTAITEEAEVITKHFTDSASLVKAVPSILNGEEKLADIGTGAGFPGIPLKIINPGLSVVLMDSLNKRIRFLDEVIRVLGLTGITAVHGRAEDIGRNPEYREQFDLCVSRAVANMATLSEYCLPLVKVGGKFIAYKSEKAEEEMKAASTAVVKLGGQEKDICGFRLPNGDERKLVIIEKTAKTPKKYPRKAGTPAKEPLS